MEPFLGTIMLFGFNFAPRGWAFCHGQTIAIAQNTALYSLLGTTYGGNGQTTFCLPDLRGRVPVGVGVGPGLSGMTWGEVGGAEAARLTQANLPAHTHAATVNARGAAGTSPNPSGARWAASTARDNQYSPDAANATMAADSVAIGPAGGGQPFDIRTPYLGMNYCIAIEGIYPSRN